MKKIQRNIINNLNIEILKRNENKEQFIERLILEKSNLLKDYLKLTSARGYVLNISGGINDFVASMLIKHAGLDLKLVSLSYGKENMEDILRSVDVINPDKFVIHNVKSAVDMQMNELSISYPLESMPEIAYNLIKSNIIEREKMSVLYSYGLIYNCLIVGLSTAVDALMGSYVKWGENACDITIFDGLTEDVIFDIATYFNIRNKASLDFPPNEESDEENETRFLDANSYLNGNEIDNLKAEKLESLYINGKDKRNKPASNNNDWWKINMEKSLLVIDCQNDFISGSLACEHAKEAVDYIAKYINENDVRPIYTMDWHTEKNKSFVENGGIWPAHCVMNTNGSKIHKDFSETEDMLKAPGLTNNNYFKGTNDDVEEYSAYNASFPGLGKRIKLSENISRDIIVCGIATEYCVKETILELLKNGFNVFLLKNGLGYVTKEGHLQTLKELEDKGVILI